MIRRTSPLFLALGLALLMGASGCKSKNEEPIDTGLTTPGPMDSDGSGSGLPDVDQENLLFSPDRGLQVVYFDYDSSSLRPDALATLRDNADKIKTNPSNVIIQIAGHCDERGTEDYNIALGERRALAVRDHLISLGVPGSRLITISFGEEMPAVEGNNEAAWRYNRRAEFNRAQSM